MASTSETAQPGFLKAYRFVSDIEVIVRRRHLGIMTPLKDAEAVIPSQLSSTTKGCTLVIDMGSRQLLHLVEPFRFLQRAGPCVNLKL